MLPVFSESALTYCRVLRHLGYYFLKSGNLSDIYRQGSALCGAAECLSEGLHKRLEVVIWLVNVGGKPLYTQSCALRCHERNYSVQY